MTLVELARSSAAARRKNGERVREDGLSLHGFTKLMMELGSLATYVI